MTARSPLAHRAAELAAAPVGLRELPLLAQVGVRLHDAPGAPPRRGGSPAGGAGVEAALGVDERSRLLEDRLRGAMAISEASATRAADAPRRPTEVVMLHFERATPG